MTTQDWRSKIAALLAKARGPGVTVEEARALEEKAAYLLNKIGIQEHELRMQSKSKQRPIFEVFRKFPPYAQSKLELLLVVAHTMGGNVVWFDSTPEMHVFAFADDLERIKLMYFNLLAQMHIETATKKIPHGQSKRAYTTSWLKGFVYGAGRRLQRAYSKANSESNALVLHDRTMRVQEELLKKFPSSKHRTMTAPLDGQGFDDGVKSGLMVDVGQDRLDKTAGQRAISDKG